MRKGIYYHFLETKEQELENNRHSLELRLNEWELVEKNKRCSQLLHLFPWEIKKMITPHDLEYQVGLELNARQVKEHLLTHWDAETKQRMLDGEQVPLLMFDLDTETEYQLLFKKWPNRDRYMIQGNWFKEFVAKRNLTAGMIIGMYWHNKSRVLRFSILGSS